MNDLEKEELDKNKVLYEVLVQTKALQSLLIANKIITSEELNQAVVNERQQFIEAILKAGGVQGDLTEAAKTITINANTES